MGYHRTRRRRKRSMRAAIDRRLERETLVSVQRDLARQREMEVVLDEQSRLKREAAERRLRRSEQSPPAA